MANDRISLIIPKGHKIECIRLAEAQGKSLNQVIIDAIEQYISAAPDLGERTILCTVVESKKGQE